MNNQNECMTLRDIFAAKTMQAMLSNPNCPKQVNDEELARQSYAMADTMLRVRESDDETPEQLGARLCREGKGISHFYGEAQDACTVNMYKMMDGYNTEMQNYNSKMRFGLGVAANDD